MEMTIGQNNDDTAITSEMKQRYFSFIDSTLLELDAQFGGRCEPVYAALTTLSANGNDFLDVKKMTPLLELIPDPIIENDMCHEAEVAKPLIRSTITEGHNVFQNIAAVQKVVVTYKEAFPMLRRVLPCTQTCGASTAVCEAGFSTLTRTLTPYRQSMLQQRPSNLILLSFERDLTQSITHDEFVKQFRL